MFARISKRKGNRFSLVLMNVVWIAVCVAAFKITSEAEFYMLAFVIGVVMGGIQSLSRATYSKLIPNDTIDHTSYFSFYDVTYNVSIVVGVFSYGLIDHLTGDMRYSALFLAFYFVTGVIMLLQIKSRDVTTPLPAT
jgi:UMF1 family MFS transporter